MRSQAKFNIVSSELQSLRPTVACVTETWLDDSLPSSSYNVEGYTAYFNNREGKSGGGVAVYVSNTVISRQCVCAVPNTDCYNICAVVIGSGPSKLLLVTVYRAPSAPTSDTENLCEQLDGMMVKLQNIVLVGDFNVPGENWATSSSAGNSSGGIIHKFAEEHGLTQIAHQSTRNDALLDLIFVSNTFLNSIITNLGPIGDSDHSAQLLVLARPMVNQNNRRVRSVVDYDRLNAQLRNIDWTVEFHGCTSAEDYATLFTNLLHSIVASCTTSRHLSRRTRLPKHIVRLLRAKRTAWLKAQATGDRRLFEAARKTAKAAIRAHRRNQEQRLVYSNSRSAFFSYINQKTRSHHPAISICVDEDCVTDQQAADIFATQFSSNFSATAGNVQPPVTPTSSRSHLSFNSTEAAVLEALVSSPNTNSSPDGISFKLLKAVSANLARPLNIIFQHSLFDGVFPSIWKHAVVTPLYKGRGDRSSPSSYRPISICSCLGKTLERVVNTQLRAFLKSHGNIHTTQHGFVEGRSTLTNHLECDRHIAKCLADGCAYDIITFDFQKAFDKAPHQCVIDAAASFGLSSRSIHWLASFLSGRTQQVKVNNCYSITHKVVSGVVQGSVLGPVLYTMLTDSLLKAITLPSLAFADDLKVIACCSKFSHQTVQDTIDVVSAWAEAHQMPLSDEKCAVMHCGKRQPKRTYMLNGQHLATVASVNDLGVIRTPGFISTEQCTTVACKASRAANCIRRSFSYGSRKLLWPAFQAYVLPTLMFCASSWAPCLLRDIDVIEKVQRRYTKTIHGLHDLPYDKRLQELGALTLVNRRTYADMTLVFKCLHGMTNCSPSALGLMVAENSTRSAAHRLIQTRIANRAHGASFSCRAPSSWNKLPLDIVCSGSLRIFKSKLYKHLLTCS
jgi:ribonuclease P/MRP protein subunit RPP40